MDWRRMRLALFWAYIDRQALYHTTLILYHPILILMEH
jgi:hypothetical protein